MEIWDRMHFSVRDFYSRYSFELPVYTIRVLVTSSPIENSDRFLASWTQAFRINMYTFPRAREFGLHPIQVIGTSSATPDLRALVPRRESRFINSNYNLCSSNGGRKLPGHCILFHPPPRGDARVPCTRSLESALDQSWQTWFVLLESSWLSRVGTGPGSSLAARSGDLS